MIRKNGTDVNPFPPCRTPAQSKTARKKLRAASEKLRFVSRTMPDTISGTTR